MEKTVNKLKFKGKGIVLNAPVDLASEFIGLGFTTTLIKTHKNSNVLVFITNNKDLLSFLNNDLDKNVSGTFRNTNASSNPNVSSSGFH